MLMRTDPFRELCHPAEGGVASASVVEALDVLEDRVRQFDPVFLRCRLSSSVCMRPQKDSMTALS